MLAKVDKEVPHLRHMDAICDILYHVKYQFTGDSIKVDAERFVKELRPALQLRLRFITGMLYPLGVNFNNTLLAPFLYESVFLSFSILTFWLCNF